jgi:hypothetical protein
MLPYCPLSDETHFDIDIDRIEFMVDPCDVVKKRYLKFLKDGDSEDRLDDDSGHMFTQGNYTLH